MEALEKKVLKRKRALLSRAPLWKKLQEKIRSYNPQEANSSLSEYLPVKKITEEIENKWVVKLIITALARPDIYGIEPMEDPEHVDGVLIVNKVPAKAFECLTVPFDSYPLVRKGEVCITVNPDLIDCNDARAIKNALWQIIKSNLGKKPNTQPIIPSKEAKELAFIYHCQNKTFNNYLRWYDLHIEKRFGFRDIAFIEKNNLYNIEEKQVPKPVGNYDHNKRKSVYYGDSKIEKGVKLIYQAIHRRPYNTKELESFSEAYHCPNHPQNNCTEKCPYLINWSDKFSHFFPCHNTQ